MTDLQFIQLLKRAFFEFFFIRRQGKAPSLMNVTELLEMYKNEVINEYKNNQKHQDNDNNNDEKQAS